MPLSRRRAVRVPSVKSIFFPRCLGTLESRDRAPIRDRRRNKRSYILYVHTTRAKLSRPCPASIMCIHERNKHTLRATFLSRSPRVNLRADLLALVKITCNIKRARLNLPTRNHPLLFASVILLLHASREYCSNAIAIKSFFAFKQ